MPIFKDLFNRNVENAICINLKDINIDNDVNAIIQRKKDESHHKVDKYKQTQRWSTGLLSEIAVGQYLNETFFDLTAGNSQQYNHSDLKSIGVNVGVKSSTYGNFPLIQKNNKEPEIIVIKQKNLFYIMGVAIPNILNTYQSDDLVKSPHVRRRNTKTGFYGFDYLLPFGDIEDLKLISNINKKQAYLK